MSYRHDAQPLLPVARPRGWSRPETQPHRRLDTTSTREGFEGTLAHVSFSALPRDNLSPLTRDARSALARDDLSPLSPVALTCLSAGTNPARPSTYSPRAPARLSCSDTSLCLQATAAASGVSPLCRGLFTSALA